MFVNAIDIVGGFTRPIFTIGRRYASAQVDPGSATLFFINEDGWALTCKHVAQMIIDAGNIEKKYSEFRQKKMEIPQGYNFDDQLKALEELYKYNDQTLGQLKVNFVDCVDKIQSFQCKIHPTIDMALIRFEGWDKLGYKGHAVFAADGSLAKQGKFLCRLGYPFPEFKNFKYDVERDDIIWTGEGMKTSPRFPVEGMVTRLIGTNEGIAGIEMSTPGLRGISGGPLFDANGTVYGMQSGISKLNLGQCIHVDVIKAFLLKEGVKFYDDKNGTNDFTGDRGLNIELMNAGSSGHKMN